MTHLSFSVNLRAAHPLHLGEDLRELAALGCSEAHLDVCDGAYASDLGGGAEMLRAVAALDGWSCDVHLLTSGPDRHIERFVDAGCRSIAVPVETGVHLHRTLGRIHDAGLEAGLILQPATPLTTLEYVLDGADRIVALMTEDGAGIGTVAAASFERIRILRENLAHRKRPITLCAKGGLGPAHAALAAEQGADVIALDASNVFSGSAPGEAFKHFREELAQARSTI